MSIEVKLDIAPPTIGIQKSTAARTIHTRVPTIHAIKYFPVKDLLKTFLKLKASPNSPLLKNPNTAAGSKYQARTNNAPAKAKKPNPAPKLGSMLVIIW